MDDRDKIIRDIAQMECKRISRKVVRALQRMTDGLQSGDDSPLKNIWDEICAQVQYEESVFWESYLDTIRTLLGREVESLSPPVKQAIWLQTDNGVDWSSEDEDQETALFSEDDITEYVLGEFVLSAAADWSNKRIRRYLESPLDLD